MRGAIRTVACVSSSFVISSLVCGQVISAQGRAHWFTPVPAAGQRLTGAESGIVGLSLNKISSGFQVQVVTPKSPGDRAGLRPGDVLLSVDGRC
jgi:S1-C subfamily serine protease